MMVIKSGTKRQAQWLRPVLVYPLYVFTPVSLTLTLTVALTTDSNFYELTFSYPLFTGN